MLNIKTKNDIADDVKSLSSAFGLPLNQIVVRGIGAAVIHGIVSSVMDIVAVIPNDVLVKNTHVYWTDDVYNTSHFDDLTIMSKVDVGYTEETVQVKVGDTYINVPTLEALCSELTKSQSEAEQMTAYSVRQYMKENEELV